MGSDVIHILLVEDDVAHGELIRRAVDSDALSVTIVRSVREAEEYLAHANPHLLLVDMCLPDGNGRELLTDQNGRIRPLIIMTAQGNEESAVEAMRAGALDYVVKSPQTFSGLRHLIDRALRQRENYVQREKAEKALQARTQELSDRVRELDCLYAISRLIETGELSQNELLEESVHLIPLAWRYADKAYARLVVGEHDCRSAGYRKSASRQIAPISVGNQPIGYIEVGYVESMPEDEEGPFSKGERELINGIAARLGMAIERRNAEIELNAAKQEAVAANCSKSEFLANMSHEIRTPMTAILGFADVLLERAEDSDSISAAMTIKRNGEHLLTIINDILDLSKIEAGKLDLETIIYPPMRIVNEVASLMRVRADAKGLSLGIEVDGAIPESIESDPTRLRQILTNLVGNAIKFTENGTVRLIASMATDVHESPVLQFDVVDTGIGMSKQQIDSLFTPFTQGDASTSRRFGGSGLGLAISKRLAGQLGGDISVSSEPGKGSTFTVTVATGSLEGVAMVDDAANIDRLKQLAEDHMHETNPVPQLNCSILLAEDGPDNQRLISFLLKKWGASVMVVENGQMAVDQVLATLDTSQGKKNGRSDSFDVVLMDMQMPIMDGYEATQALRQAGFEDPIIALTAHAMSHDRQKCFDCGCTDYVAKPIDHAMLAQTIARHTSASPSHPDF